MAKNKGQIVWLLHSNSRELGFSTHGIYRTKALAQNAQKEIEPYFPKHDFSIESQEVIDEET